MSACVVMDNYDAPDAQFYGSVIDIDTDQPIQQDKVNGSMIHYVELGLTYQMIQQMPFETDGTFRDNLFFSGKYEVEATRGNFYPTEPKIIEIHGKTEHVFRTRPYIRINDVELTYDEVRGRMTAEFTLDQVSTNKVESIHLMADRNAGTSFYLQSAMKTAVVDEVVAPTQKFSLTLPTTNFVSGKDYYFRVAAMISGIPEAKHNYSAPVKFTMDNSRYVEVPRREVYANMIDYKFFSFNDKCLLAINPAGDVLRYGWNAATQKFDDPTTVQTGWKQYGGSIWNSVSDISTGANNTLQALLETADLVTYQLNEDATVVPPYNDYIGNIGNLYYDVWGGVMFIPIGNGKHDKLTMINQVNWVFNQYPMNANWTEIVGAQIVTEFPNWDLSPYKMMFMCDLDFMGVTESGVMYLHKFNPSSFTVADEPIIINGNWSGFTHITAFGTNLLARDATGKLWMYDFDPSAY